MNENDKVLEEHNVEPKLNWFQKLGHGLYGVSLIAIFVVIWRAFTRITSQKRFKVVVATLITGSILGYIWGLIVHPMWVFPKNAYWGIEILGMILEDWLFYPITGGMFIYLMRITKPKVEKINIAMNLLYIFILCCFTILPFFAFGKCGCLIAIIFGIPAILCWVLTYKNIATNHFNRLFLVVVIIEVTWDHIAAGYFKQWIYLPNSGWYNTILVINGIPVEMTPYLAVIAAPLIFGTVKFFEKVIK